MASADGEADEEYYDEEDEQHQELAPDEDNFNDVAKVETIRYADELNYYEDDEEPGVAGQGRVSKGVYPVE